MFINVVNLSEVTQVTKSTDTGKLLNYANLYRKDELALINKQIPTLYVGSELAESIYPDLNPIEHRLSDTEFWCFSEEESTTYYIHMLRKFLADVPDGLVRNLTYKVIDPIFKDPLLNLKGVNLDVVYHRNNHIFFSKENMVYGINLDLLDGLGKKEHVQALIYKQGRRLVKDDNNKIFSFFVNTFKFDANIVERYIPYLINLKEKL
jgi:hypothetical protein